MTIDERSPEVRLSLLEQRQQDTNTSLVELNKNIHDLERNLISRFDLTAQGIARAMLASVKSNKEDIVNLQRRLDDTEQAETISAQLLAGTIKQVENHRRLLFGDPSGDSISITELARSSLRIAQAAERIAREGLSVARATEQGLDKIADIVERLVAAEERRVEQRQVTNKTIKTIMDKGPLIVAGAGTLVTALGGVWTSFIQDQPQAVVLIIVVGGIAFTLFASGVLVMLRSAFIHN